MRMTSLIDINADTLLYSSVDESTESEYDKDTSYSEGDVVKVSYEGDDSIVKVFYVWILRIL